MTAGVYVGTAAWAVPRPLADRFPAEGSQLERYAARLGAAEINSSFYRPHRRQTYKRWAASVPEAFRFAVKLPKAISHAPSLAGHDAAITAFAEQVTGLGDKLGALLVQFAPRRAFAADADALFDRLATLPCPIACEPRHASWFTPDVDAWLAARRIARVAADPARVPGADVPGGWPGLRYFRLHGSPQIYRSDYDDAALAAWQAAVAVAAAGAPTWCIFDNTTAYAATGNALSLAAALAIK
ncbi:DUF72 domain-containing protein [Sandarakinorhabdus sp. DWP1-3-1]|uniref:DUF72 domain-containing protein n=1 Tax=Sandarakinorhabdus sp. DWP1-3-1 TaxID=2804627 RepID=UPI003CF314C3